MAADLQQNFATVAELAVSGFDALATDAAISAASVDLGNPAPFALSLQVAASASTGATANGFVEIFGKWSINDADFAPDLNDRLIAVMLVSSNTQEKLVTPAPVEGQYLSLRIKNRTGGALSTGGNSARFSEVAVDQA